MADPNSDPKEIEKAEKEVDYRMKLAVIEQGEEKTGVALLALVISMVSLAVSILAIIF